MDKLMKIDATAVSHSTAYKSGNNFYINGRHMYEHEEGNIQVSVENQGEEYIFAVSNGMDKASSEKGTSISMMKELKKFQEKIRGTGGDLASKLVQLKDKVEEVNNVIYSMNIGSQQTEDQGTAFAGIFLLDGKAAVLSSGRSKIFLLREGKVKLLTCENKKAEKLLKMGIITEEQASSFGGRVAIGSRDGRMDILKSDLLDVQSGDTFFVLNEGIINALDNEKIHEIISISHGTGYLANLVIKEALKNDVKDNITALVVRVSDVNSQKGSLTNIESNQVRKRYKQSERKKRENYRTTVAAVLACITIIGVLSAVFYKALLPGKENSVMEESVVNASSTEATMGTVPAEDEKPAEDIVQSSEEASSANEENNDEVQKEQQEVSRPIEVSENTEEIKHVVKSGETLEKISKKYYGKMEKYKIIMERNEITNPNSLKVGQELIIPKE